MADRELGLRFYKWLLTHSGSFLSGKERRFAAEDGASHASPNSDVSSSRTLPMRLRGSGAQSWVLLPLLVILKSRMDS